MENNVTDFDDFTCPSTHTGKKARNTAQWFGHGEQIIEPHFQLMCDECYRIWLEFENWEYSLICN